MLTGDHPGGGEEDSPIYDSSTVLAVRSFQQRTGLEAKGVITAEQVRARMEQFEEDLPYRGSRVVARAWVDPAFRKRLFTDANAAAAELGYPITTTKLVAVENTDDVHNVVVCTLCSCYPRDLLGLPPAWYKSRAYRARVVREPRAVLREFGTDIADDVAIHVHDSTADIRFLVVPQRPRGTESLDEAELARIVTRDSMIGVALLETAAH